MNFNPTFLEDPDMPKREARRLFLKQMAAASAATMMMGEPKRMLAGDLEQPKPTADACILLWMAGGMAAPDTFDPKRYVPFEVGTPVKDIESTFPAIDTVVDPIKITRGLENVAKIIDRGTLIRSHVLPDLGSILHSRHQYHWHTGYVPPQTVACPHLGAWMARAFWGRGIPSFPLSSPLASDWKGLASPKNSKPSPPQVSLGTNTVRWFSPIHRKQPSRFDHPREWKPDDSKIATHSIVN